MRERGDHSSLVKHTGPRGCEPARLAATDTSRCMCGSCRCTNKHRVKQLKLHSSELSSHVKNRQAEDGRCGAQQT